jgi:hypothetical protein
MRDIFYQHDRETYDALGKGETIAIAITATKQAT